MRPTFPHVRFPVFTAILAVLACGVFLPGLHGGFIFDDAPNIVSNANLHVSRWNLDDLLYAAYSFQAGHGSRALSMLSFALDYLRGGSDPTAFKSTNLFIHGLTTWVLAMFLRKLLVIAQWSPRQANLTAAFVATLWAIHPLQVSTVLYVVQRMQMLCTMFMALSLWSYLNMRQAQIHGERSRLQCVLTLLFWTLGFAGKEDAVLLPAYTFALELTVLRFHAASPRLAKAWRISYGGLAAGGMLVYVVYVIPHYWSWEYYPTRDFSTFERLLTQGRVLVMYLGQSLWPRPDSLPFFYDNLTISRGLWSPPTTLPAWTLLAGLLIWAWMWRARYPVFALGVMLFFAGHAITSNVIGLELAFEHRNNFPLIGVLLAVVDLVTTATQRIHVRSAFVLPLTGLAFIMLACLTIERSFTWGNPLRLAESHVSMNPGSARAWMSLCGYYFQRSEAKKGSPDLETAIATCQQGAQLTQSPSLLSNAVIFKSIEGTATPNDWNALVKQLRNATMNPENKGILNVTLSNADRGVPLDEAGVTEVIEAISARTNLSKDEYLRVGTYLFNESHHPAKAMMYFRSAVEHSPHGDPDIDRLLQQLSDVGRDDWAERLKQVRRANLPR